MSESPLRQALEAAATETGCSLKALTVLSIQRDPFRLDTPASHRDGKWLADRAADLGLGDQVIHLRGLHYAISLAPRTYLKPDGLPYANNDDDWVWQSEVAAKSARWLGYIPFDQIADHRNAPPVIRGHAPPNPYAYLSTELDIEIPYDITPTLYTADFRGVQPRKLVIFGEKSSLEPVLGPIAQDYEAGLYLPTGEISDTLLYRMASVAAADGRPMVVLCFSNCDPGGWQMPVSIARKLQALKLLVSGMPDFEVHRVAVTPAQVREHGLPSKPLKATEKRADKWRAVMGVEHTEIDVFVPPNDPTVLQQIARQALDGFYDHTLARRIARYHSEWLSQARRLIAPTLDTDRLAEIRRHAEEQLDGMRSRIRELNDSLRIDVDEDDLPQIELPEAIDPGGNGFAVARLAVGLRRAVPPAHRLQGVRGGPVIQALWGEEGLRDYQTHAASALARREAHGLEENSMTGDALKAVLVLLWRSRDGVQ